MCVVYAVFSSFQPFLWLSVALTIVYAFYISMCLKSAKIRLLVRPVFFCAKTIKKTGCLPASFVNV
nr:MAG TPA: hypothetical protein [Caudoviricetes sp.]